MQVNGAGGRRLATVGVAGKPDKVLGADVDVLDGKLRVSADVKLEVAGDGLVAHVRLPAQRMACDVVVEPDDVNAVLAGVDGSVVKFAMRALMRRGR